MKITKIDTWSAANFLGLLGVATGAIKGVILPVLALLGAGAMGDIDAGIAKVSTTVSADLGSVVAFGIAGWVGGWVYAWMANWVLKWTKALRFETNK